MGETDEQFGDRTLRSVCMFVYGWAGVGMCMEVE